VVARCDEVGNVLARDAESLFQETDDHVRRGAHRIEDIAGVNDQVHISLQNCIDSPSVSLLDVDLALITASLLMEPRVPRVSQMSIRDVGDLYDLIPLFNPALFRPEYLVDAQGPCALSLGSNPEEIPSGSSCSSPTAASPVGYQRLAHIYL
jgi:hypothetical protein